MANTLLEKLVAGSSFCCKHSFLVGHGVNGEPFPHKGALIVSLIIDVDRRTVSNWNKRIKSGDILPCGQCKPTDE